MLRPSASCSSGLLLALLLVGAAGCGKVDGRSDDNFPGSTAVSAPVQSYLIRALMPPWEKVATSGNQLSLAVPATAYGMKVSDIYVLTLDAQVETGNDPMAAATARAAQART